MILSTSRDEPKVPPIHGATLMGYYVVPSYLGNIKLYYLINFVSFKNLFLPLSTIFLSVKMLRQKVREHADALSKTSVSSLSGSDGSGAVSVVVTNSS